MVTKRKVTKRKFNTFIPILLLALAAVPVIGGMVRLVQLSGATIDFLPESERILAAANTAFILHIVSSVFYIVVGAFQFSHNIRRRWPKWHRKMGMVVGVAGLFAAISALWLTLFFPPAANDNALLYIIRLIVAPAMAGFIVLGIIDAKRRRFDQHRAWMMRSYALGAGAGTQVLLLGPWTLLSEPDVMTRAILMGSAWVINLIIAEWFIAKKKKRKPKNKFWNWIANFYAKQPIEDPDSYERKLDITAKLLRPDMRILEFGCGTGGTALRHAAHVKEIRAVDYAPRMIEIARQNQQAAGIENVSFTVGDLHTFAPGQVRYDGVFAMSILHLVDDRDAALGKFRSLLRPGDLFVSSTKCIGDETKLLKYLTPIGMALGIFPTVRVFTTVELCASIKAAGFDIEQQWKPGRGKATFIVAKAR